MARLAKSVVYKEPAVLAPGANLVHTDAYARKLGFKGALVPGVTLMGYITEMLTGLFGETWFEHGALSVFFRSPVYHSEHVVISGVLRERSEQQGSPHVVLDISMQRPSDGRVVVTGQAACHIPRLAKVAR